MIQVTIFAGHDGRLRYDKWFYLTLFAGCDLVRPTVARQLLMRRHAEQEGHAAVRKPFFLTIFAGVGITSPTLAEEFIDLREMVHGGALNMDDWERAMADLGRARSPRSPARGRCHSDDGSRAGWRADFERVPGSHVGQPRSHDFPDSCSHRRICGRTDHCR